MVVQQAEFAPTFAGTPEEQRLAQQVFALMSARGQQFASDAPIRVSIESVAGFLSMEGVTADQVQAAAAANPSVFEVADVNGVRVLVTTRAGRVPRLPVVSAAHSFQRRLMTPRPKPERPALPARERPRVAPAWVTLPSVLGELAMQAPVEEAEPAVEAPAAEAAPTEAAPAEVAPAAEVQAPAEEIAAPAEPARTITVPAAARTDMSGIADGELAAAISERLRADPRVANFRDLWMMEDRVPRFSRGDLRRMRDYIQEQERPLTDDVLVQDVLGVRPSSPEFDLMRFAVNFRLSREHREFEFVGTADQRFWSTSSLPAIGTTRRKPNEIGVDYRFLLEEVAEPPAPHSVASVDHTLTFYEYLLGLLPYDAAMQALLPAPLLPNQRSAVLTFECPQSYTTYLVELRYPSPNRGGYILGLDDFYTESLVPGAMISITRTENDGHYLVEFLPAESQQARLLELDERRARYVFRPTTFGCGVADEMLLTEERFPRLAGDKPLEERVRRRPEAVVAATFERIGEPNDGGFWATFDDLLAAVNIERPFSPALLRSVLDQDDTGAFARDNDGTDAYTYVPGNNS